MCLGLARKRHRPIRESGGTISASSAIGTGQRPRIPSLAETYQHLNQPDKAEETYKRAIAVRPQYWRGYSLLGIFYIKQAEYEKAAAMFRRATELDPENYLAFNNLGGSLLYEGKDDEAAQAFEKSMALRPNRDAYNNIAVAQFRLHRYKNSAANFKEALKIDDTDYQTWGNMGDAYYDGGETSAAATAYNKAIPLAEPQLSSILAMRESSETWPVITPC